ncbi:MAG TPA: hypothetical protein VGM88_19080 [Kofleriaceae bacterium]|jgi:hypothetical protein
MNDLDRFFEKPEPVLHPRLRYLRGVLDRHEVPQLRVEFRQDRDGLDVGDPRLLVLLQDGEGRDVGRPEEFEWEPDVNDVLMTWGIKAITIPNESLRFGAVLRDRLEVVETRFGDGFFSGVLTEYLGSSAWSSKQVVSAMLAEVHAYHPSPGPQRDACREGIEEVVGACVDLLYKSLAYSKAETINILSAALALYLDHRFHVSERKMLGWT